MKNIINLKLNENNICIKICETNSSGIKIIFKKIITNKQIDASEVARTVEEKNK